jgi:hypothetical protein
MANADATLTVLLLLSAQLASAQAASGQVGEVPTELLWEIGGVEAPEFATWIRIDRGVIGADRVVVSDTRAPSVRAYHIDDGRWLTTYGGAGSGPGEYEAPSDVTIVGDTVQILDIAQRRWSLYTPDGSHYSTRTSGHPPAPIFIRWSKVSDEGQQFGFTAGADYGVGDVGRSVIFWRNDDVDTLQYFPMNEVFFQWRGDPQWWSTHFGIGPAGDAAPVGDSLVAVLDGIRGVVSLISTGNRGTAATRSFDLGAVGRPVTTDDKEWIAVQVENALNGLHPRWEDQLRTPAQWSAWTGILSDSDEAVWIRRGGREHAFQAGGEVWHKLSLQSGTVVSHLRLPSDTRLLAVRKDLLMTVRTDELDIEYLQLRAIR